MARKVFISILGSSNYGVCKYAKDDYISSEVRYIQEATLEYLGRQEPWTSSDKAYILLTKGERGSYAKNWLDNGHRDRATNNIIESYGLKTCLDNMNLPYPVEPICDLPNGDNEDEIWEIFNKVFSHIEQEDELYFDLTHGFRYLPMLILVLGNYSKFLKNVKVKSITYGNFEGRNLDSNTAQIVDLLPLSVLQDWTYAAGQYLDSGNVDKLVQLCESEYKLVLRDTKGADQDARKLRDFTTALANVIEERQACRGMSIYNSTSFNRLEEISNGIESTTITPLNPVFQKIKESFECFDRDQNILNCYHAARWCYDNKMYQQAATMLQDFVISYMCHRIGLKIDDENERGLITSAFTIKNNNLSQEEWKGVDKEKMAQILKNKLFNDKKIIDSFNNLSEVRNDFNHSGFRSRRLPLTPKSIKDNVKLCLDAFSVLC